MSHDSSDGGDILCLKYTVHRTPYTVTKKPDNRVEIGLRVVYVDFCTTFILIIVNLN